VSEGRRITCPCGFILDDEELTTELLRAADGGWDEPIAIPMPGDMLCRHEDESGNEESPPTWNDLVCPRCGQHELVAGGAA
jgi:hypothetical protein